VQGGRLHHTLNVGGLKVTVSSDAPLQPGRRKLGVQCRQRGTEGRTFTLLVDGKAAGAVNTRYGFLTLISFSGLDIGRDRSSPVGDYAAPFAFTGSLRRVDVTMDDDQILDGEALGEAEMARD
jgi:hypothetical protein